MSKNEKKLDKLKPKLCDCSKIRQYPAFQLYYLARLVLTVPALILFIISVVMLQDDPQVYADLIKSETADWNLYPITDFITIPITQFDSSNGT